MDEKIKLEDKNPSIGIIICKSKKRTILEYALKSARKPIGVATYNIYDQLPENMKGLLPTPEEISKRLGALDEDL